MIIKLGDFQNQQVQDLLRLHLEGMHASSPPGHVFALDWSGLQRPDVTFYTNWDGDRLAGCAAIKQLSATHGEIKSMRTHPDYLRQGVSTHLLRKVIDVAIERGCERLSLETGSGPAFEPALALYRRHGFKSCGAFGGYVKSDFNQFMELDLSNSQHR